MKLAQVVTLCKHNKIANVSFICIFFFFSAALDFFKSHPSDPVDAKAFELACGIGVVITPEQIEDAVSLADLSQC